jgi:hypothetical protein
MSEIVGGTDWLAAQRDAIRAEAIDWVARQRLAMKTRIRPVIEPLPPMTQPPVSIGPPPQLQSHMLLQAPRSPIT